MDYEIIDLQSKKRWRELLSELPSSQRDIYFLPEYYELCHNSGKEFIRCFVFRHKERLALYPFIATPVSGLGLLDSECEYCDIQGAYGYNGVISSSCDATFIDAFYEAFSQHCIESGVVAEFARFHPFLNNHEFSSNHMDVLLNRQTVWLDLTQGHDAIWEKSYASRNRNMIRKALKNNLSAEFSTGLDSYKRFYDLYKETMKRLQADGFYFFDWSYFQQMFERLGKMQFIVEVLHDGSPIASILVLHCGEYAHYHLSARDDNFHNLGAGNLALDAAIKRLAEAGCKKFNLGGGFCQDDSLFKFKSSFSKERMNFYIGKKIHNQDIYQKLCKAWEEKNPEKKETYSKFILKYRK